MCFGIPAVALDPSRTLAQYLRDYWGSEKGFSGGSVTAIAQTSDGYLWIGTERGLIRFDGLNFHTFPQAIPATFAIGPVQALASDNKGNLWVLLQNTKILRYHAGNFEQGREQAEVGLTSLARKRDDSVVFASLARGTLVFQNEKFVEIGPSPDPTSNPPLPDGQPSDNRLSWATGVAPHRFAEPNSAVTAMAETPDGKLWLGTRDKGLFYQFAGKVIPAGKGLSDSKVNCLLALNDGDVWVGTDKGIVRWTGEALTDAGIPESLRHTQILSMLRDRDANIWVGTTSGLQRVNAQGVATDSGMLAVVGQVSALFEDREGDLWVGHSRGIERLRDGMFVTYVAGDLQSESSGPIYVDRQQRVWFAPFEGGLHWMRDGNVGKVTTEGLASDVVYSIDGTNDELWVGRQRGGLTRLRLNGRALSAKTFTQADGLAQNSVYSVYLSPDGTVWAGTLSGGVSTWKNGKFTTYTTANGLASDNVTAVAQTPDGAIWFATPNGVSRLQNGAWHTIGSKDGLPTDTTNCLLADSQGVLWIGTASGLAFFRTNKLGLPSGGPDALREQILGLAEDKKGFLWISTSAHVLRVSREKLLENDLHDIDVTEYGLEDGLRGIEGIKRDRSVFADSWGKIWLSMNRGLSVVNPARISNTSPPALVHVDAMTVDGNTVPLQEPIRLAGPHRRITFNYAALSLSVPERVRYKYKLENVDEGWSNEVAAREVTYNNLSSGPYRFRVIASNSEGRWNSAESEIFFAIQPAYWQTWWFRISFALLVALAVVLLIRLRMRALAARLNMRFEERLAERTRIAQELHDTLLQGFVSASMQLHVANDRVSGDSPAKPMIGRVLELMTRVIDEGRNTVRGLRSSELVNSSLEESFSRMQQELAPSWNTGFRVIVEGTPRTLRPVIRDETYFVGREGLVNAFRHSGATEIVIEIEYDPNHLRVMVRDNGRGIDPQVLHTGREGHFGLSGMRERAERIGARLRVLSRAAAGTEIELSVPSRIAFEPERVRPMKQWLSWLYSHKLYSHKDDEATPVAETKHHD